MAYRRSTAKRSSRTYQRSTKRYTPRRRYVAKKRTYRKKPAMSKRRILNITSEKKRDKMMSYTNVNRDNPSGGTTYAANPAILVGGSVDPYVFVWCATGRDNTTNSVGRPGTKFDKATRTSSSCYMVGLKEAVQIQVLNGLPWQWRRICFTYKGRGNLNSYLPNPSAFFQPVSETSNGYLRTINGLTSSESPTFFELLFQGSRNTDWSDPLSAKVDTERVSLKYDKTITISSGNEEGVIRKYPRWHGMNHNLQYDDDESGGAMTSSYYSVESKVGMGDYWVIDIIIPRVGSDDEDLCTFGTESTLYWHEK